MSENLFFLLTAWDFTHLYSFSLLTDTLDINNWVSSNCGTILVAVVVHVSCIPPQLSYFLAWTLATQFHTIVRERHLFAIIVWVVWDAAGGKALALLVCLLPPLTNAFIFHCLLFLLKGLHLHASLAQDIEADSSGKSSHYGTQKEANSVLVRPLWVPIIQVHC